MGTAALLVYVAATLYMAGVNWFLQVVHHPLYDRIGRDGFAAYETAYNRLIGPVIILPSIVAILAALASSPRGRHCGSCWSRSSCSR